jgi:hypothetical protein
VKENRFVIHASTLEQRLADEAKGLSERSNCLTKDREELLRKARQNEVAAHIRASTPKVNLKQDSWKPREPRLRSPPENKRRAPDTALSSHSRFQMDGPSGPF